MGHQEDARQLCWCKGAPEGKDLDCESESVVQNEGGSGLPVEARDRDKRLTMLLYSL